MTVVRDQLFPQKPPGSRFRFSRTGVQPSPGSSTIELPSAFAESGAHPPDRELPGSPRQCSLPLACRHPPEEHHGHKEVRRSTGHIMVTTRYSDQQGSKSRQKVMRLYKQWHRPISKRFIKPPYSISRATSIDSECCRLPTTSVLSKKPEKLRSNQF